MVRMMPSPPKEPQFDTVATLEQVLSAALKAGASDVHIEPTPAGAEVRLRVDGLLQLHATHPPAAGRALVTRLMVLAELLTYRLDVPQEGRFQVQLPDSAAPLDLRVAVMTTYHVLRAAVRLPAELIQPRTLDDLGLPPPILDGLNRFIRCDAGMLLITGPAGAGKTTTIYALLEQIAQHQPGLSIISLEDPVERVLKGVTQIEISPFGQLTYERALRSILRQDPQVLMLGEIRDPQTASLASQAALSGHRLICTLHAATPGGALSRLMEMGLEPYQLTSSIYGVVSQRLLRRLDGGGAYRGRVPAATFVAMDQPLRSAIAQHADADALQSVAAQQPGHLSLRESASRLVDAKITDLSEVERVMGALESDA
jgi:type II secretory ATPase GspE/PulE/Tfp pilus assembly ATPase PilB-like protein